MLDWSAGTLLAWMEQAFLLAAAGSLLLALFRIRDPRVKLTYCHALLMVCLALPWIQPWRHPVIVRDSGAKTITETAIGIAAPVLWVLLVGALVKLCWLMGGLWRIRKYRIASMPLYPIPEPVRAAWAVTHTDSLFCISPDVPGPVMLGWLTPVVLLPESFLTLGEEAQCGIACHELLHVRRHDWLVTMLEELAGTLLWFNPAIWPLLAQTRLAREQLVDAEVVRLTAAREPYIDALLAIARGGSALDLAPAPLFLRRRHLAQRVHSLLQDVATSRPRILSSCACMTAMLGLAGWLGFTSFPLIGQPVYQDAPRAIAAAPAAPLPAVSSAIKTPRPASVIATQVRTAPPATPIGTPADYIPSAPIPSDPHELLSSGSVRPLTSPADRAAALALLERARQNAQLHTASTPPYRFDASFTAAGNAALTGTGQLTEIRLSGQRWRWTADLSGYSVVRIANGGRTLEERPVETIPMRVQTLRNAILWIIREGSSGVQLRSASVEWDGKPLTCLLLSNMAGQATLTQRRLWEEDEYCIENASGLLQIYSIAPGTYSLYGYSRKLSFHGETLPDHISIYTGGVLAAEAEFTIADASASDEALLAPSSGMHNVTITDGSPTRFQIRTANPLASTVVQPVIVHAQIGGDGRVVEEEVSAAADPALAQAALDLVKHSNLPFTFATQRQAYINVRFFPQ